MKDELVTLAAASVAWRQQRRVYRDLVKLKFVILAVEALTAESSSPRQLWRLFDELMGRKRVPMSTAVGVDEIHWFYDEKVVGVHSPTAYAPPLSFCMALLHCAFRNIQLLTNKDVVNGFRLLPDKQCMSDPLRTHLLKGIR